ncbi:hypothetical protein, variant 2 [Aphanomyces invadans]|nr:hypothetical protein, variant 2 [Aphanomyces invadans]ETV99574.1 hypothetical protein, variant 2 [Aphanomyces invadans]|eukprot:XP_008872130.1 hypothetical protein, variant 2 [Aphanomyces invadans]
MDYAQKPEGLPRGDILLDLFGRNSVSHEIHEDFPWKTLRPPSTGSQWGRKCSTNSSNESVVHVEEDAPNTVKMRKIESALEFGSSPAINFHPIDASKEIFESAILDEFTDFSISTSCNWYDELNRWSVLVDSVNDAIHTSQVLFKMPTKDDVKDEDIVTFETIALPCTLTCEDVVGEKEILHHNDMWTSNAETAPDCNQLTSKSRTTQSRKPGSGASPPQFPQLFENVRCPQPSSYLDEVAPKHILARQPGNNDPRHVIRPIDIGLNLSALDKGQFSWRETNLTTFESARLDDAVVFAGTEDYPTSIFDLPLNNDMNLNDTLFEQESDGVHIHQLQLPPTNDRYLLDAFLKAFRTGTKDIFDLAVAHTPTHPRISPSTLSISMPSFCLATSSNVKDMGVLYDDEPKSGESIEFVLTQEIPPKEFILVSRTSPEKKRKHGETNDNLASKPKRQLRCRKSTLQHVNELNTIDPSKQDSNATSPLHKLISRAARPLIWKLSSKKVLRIEETASKSALQHLSLGSLNSKLQAKYLDLKRIQSSATLDEKLQRAQIIRDLFFVHTLRLTQQVLDEHGVQGCKTFVRTCVTKSKVERLLGEKYIVQLRNLIRLSQDEEDLPVVVTPEKIPTRNSRPCPVLISVDLPISVDVNELLKPGEFNQIHRELEPPLSLIIGMQVGLCVVEKAIFLDDNHTKQFAFQVAQIQHQFAKIWVILENYPSGNAKEVDKLEQCYLAFATASMGYSIPVVAMISTSPQESATYIRKIIKQHCSSVMASNAYRYFVPSSRLSLCSSLKISNLQGKKAKRSA